MLRSKRPVRRDRATVEAAIALFNARRDARPQEEKDREAAEMAACTLMGTTPAPTGQVFVCGACGKTSTTRYGPDAKNGWDESCMLHAVLCFTEKTSDGKWRAVQQASEGEKR